MMHGHSRMKNDTFLKYWDRARRVFTDQADIACTKRETPRGVQRVA